MLKPPPDRLYGRVRGHKLRNRQAWLLAEILPRLRWPDAPFGDVQEVWLEVGFGGGEHAEALARDNPQAGLIAAEVFEPGISSMLSRLAPMGMEFTVPGNLRLFTDDARQLIRAMPDGFLSKLFLMFPDPWPKTRHAKRRFVYPALLPDLARVLKPGAEWRVASDDPTYQAWVDEILRAQALFNVTSRTKSRPKGWPPTRYEAKALAAERQPIYWTIHRGGGEISAI
jgi:tRNA (guanine-N7-)-methyltransferase